MPRKARIDAPGALHHVMVRGIDRRDIFSDQKDYSDFMDRLGDLLIETRTSCYAWALIPNHFHLLLRTGNARNMQAGAELDANGCCLSCEKG